MGSKKQEGADWTVQIHVRFLSVQEAAEALRVDKATLRRYIRAGLVPAVKLRRRVLVPERALEQLVEKACYYGE
jgi:excisionase family DNA binding protein